MIKLLILTSVKFRVDEDRHTVGEAKKFHEAAKITSREWEDRVKAVAVTGELEEGLQILADEILAVLYSLSPTAVAADFRFEVAITEFKGNRAWLSRNSVGGPLGGYSLADYIS